MLLRNTALFLLVSVVAGCSAGTETGDSRSGLGEANPVEIAYDQDGRPLLGRAAPDHELLEDGSIAVSDRPLTLLIVFDTSGSMSTNWGSRSRWQTAYDAVSSAVAEFQETITVGAVVFPSDGNCGVLPIESERQFDFMRGPEFLTAWHQDMAGPSGNTPLHLGLMYADEAIARATQQGLLENRFRVLVFSDGEPTCGDDLDAIQYYPTRWLGHGIHTYVVALPGSEGAASLLDAMANAGGTGAEQGGGAAIRIDETAQEVYEEGVEEQGASRVVVDDEEDLDDVTHAAAR